MGAEAGAHERRWAEHGTGGWSTCGGAGGTSVGGGIGPEDPRAPHAAPQRRATSVGGWRSGSRRGCLNGPSRRLSPCRLAAPWWWRVAAAVCLAWGQVLEVEGGRGAWGGEMAAQEQVILDVTLQGFWMRGEVEAEGGLEEGDPWGGVLGVGTRMAATGLRWCGAAQEDGGGRGTGVLERREVRGTGARALEGKGRSNSLSEGSSSNNRGGSRRRDLAGGCNGCRGKDGRRLNLRMCPKSACLTSLRRHGGRLRGGLRPPRNGSADCKKGAQARRRSGRRLKRRSSWPRSSALREGRPIRPFRSPLKGRTIGWRGRSERCKRRWRKRSARRLASWNSKWSWQQRRRKFPATASGYSRQRSTVFIWPCRKWPKRLLRRRWPTSRSWLRECRRSGLRRLGPRREPCGWWSSWRAERRWSWQRATQTLTMEETGRRAAAARRRRAATGRGWTWTAALWIRRARIAANSCVCSWRPPRGASTRCAVSAQKPSAEWAAPWGEVANVEPTARQRKATAKGMSRWGLCPRSCRWRPCLVTGCALRRKRCGTPRSAWAGRRRGFLRLRRRGRRQRHASPRRQRPEPPLLRGMAPALGCKQPVPRRNRMRRVGRSNEGGRAVVGSTPGSRRSKTTKPSVGGSSGLCPSLGKGPRAGPEWRAEILGQAGVGGRGGEGWDGSNGSSGGGRGGVRGSKAPTEPGGGPGVEGRMDGGGARVPKAAIGGGRPGGQGARSHPGVPTGAHAGAAGGRAEGDGSGESAGGGHRNRSTAGGLSGGGAGPSGALNGDAAEEMGG